MDNNIQTCSISDLFCDRDYIIPLYQRNFAWRQEEVQTLLLDIYDAQTTGQENYYIGTLVTIKRPDGKYEVIDGQQRLTVLSLLVNVLGISSERHLYYDCRPEVESYFDALFSTEKENSFHKSNIEVSYIQDALQAILSCRVNETTFVKDCISNYVATNVKIILTEIPEDTDVAKYFEIMNNRGEQLEQHELVKASLMGLLDNLNDQIKFARIWDACSQMDSYVDSILDKNTNNENNEDEATIDSICETALFYADSNDKDNTNEERFHSIIDFPNFLMIVLKMAVAENSEIIIPLTSQKIQQGFANAFPFKEKSEEANKAIMNFADALLKYRRLFDKYIVKTVKNDSQEEGVSWSLQKYEDNNATCNTFENNKMQRRIVKAISMLQVSSPSRERKDWLYMVLKKIHDNISPTDYISVLDNIIQGIFSKYSEATKNITPDSIIASNDSIFNQGINTPHNLFLFIDYLLWIRDWWSKEAGDRHIADFDFKYWNSVEHHAAQKWIDNERKIEGKEAYTIWINTIGNLCLVSKSTNSSLGAMSPEQKVAHSEKSNQGAKRQLMYSATENNKWTVDDIRDHSCEILDLLKCSNQILKIPEK